MNTPPNCYIFIGPPGSGKGSLAQMCIDKFGWRQLSTGNLCRQHISEGTKIGEEIDFLIKSGRLVPDSLVSSMVADWLEKQVGDPTTMILDGFPRTKEQAEYLDSVLDRVKVWKLKIVNLKIDDALVVDRLANRFICQNEECQAIYSLDPSCMELDGNDFVCEVCNESLYRRKDDKPEAIRKRLEVYHRHEEDLLRFYRDGGHSIITLDVEMPLLEVYKNFKNLAGID